MLTVKEKKLITDNIGLVRSIAGKYKNRRLSYEDLVQEGTMGLIHAAQKYDPEKGIFSSYAYRWIQRYLQGYLAKNAYAINIPFSVFRQGNTKKCKEIVNKMFKKYLVV